MHSPFARIATTAFALLAIGAAPSVQAQATIDQAKALAGIGGFDDPGFPVTISSPGSYKLMGNLAVPYGKTGIEITVRGVTLDLNGFSVLAPGSCPRNEDTYVVKCMPDRVGNIGIDFKAGGNTLRNGEVRGFITGVQYKGGDRLEDLLVKHNVHGVVSQPYNGARTLIRGVRVENSEESGFWAHDALIQGSTSASNGGNGFLLLRSMVVDSFAFQNRGKGFLGTSNETYHSIAVGRSVSWGNKGGSFMLTRSLGENLE